MNKEPIIISQSLIKASDSDSNPDWCPRKVQAIYLKGMQSEPSETMEVGNYFETLAFGATDSGMRTQAPIDKRTGSIKLKFQRAQVHAARFLSEYKEKYKMNFLKQRHHIHVQIEGEPNYILRARLDILTSLYDPINFPDEPLHPIVIMDTKMTGSILSTYPPFSWGAPQLMDHIQADLYSMCYEAKHGKAVPFYYLVMDTSPQMKHMLYYKPVTTADKRIVRERIRRTIATINLYNDSTDGGDWPARPNADNCKRCPLSEICPEYSKGITIKTIYSTH